MRSTPPDDRDDRPISAEDYRNPNATNRSQRESTASHEFVIDRNLVSVYSHILGT
jgi:hypothetical protein